MKKFILSVVAVVAFTFGVNAQTEGLNFGIHGGTPVGDLTDVSSFVIGSDASYLFPVSDDFVAGIRAGYNNIFGKTIEYGSFKVKVQDVSFVPVSATGEYLFTDALVGALDLGYAFGTKKNSEGAFYYQPKVGYILSESFKALVGYEGMSKDGTSVNVISFGIQFAFQQ